MERKNGACLFTVASKMSLGEQLGGLSYFHVHETIELNHNLIEFQEQPKQEITDELQSFYNDIAELEKHTDPDVASTTPEPPAAPTLCASAEPLAPPAPVTATATVCTAPAVVAAPAAPAPAHAAHAEHAQDKEKDGRTKKKSKVSFERSSNCLFHHWIA